LRTKVAPPLDWVIVSSGVAMGLRSVAKRPLSLAEVMPFLGSGTGRTGPSAVPQWASCSMKLGVALTGQIDADDMRSVQDLW
jgi:hypothetical protein